LTGHGWRKRLGKSYGLHDTVLDSHDKTLLLLRACTNADRSKKLPDIDIFTSVDCTRENGSEGRFKNIKEVVICSDPGR